MRGALHPLTYMCPNNFLSHGCIEKSWSSTSTPIHVSPQLFITWLLRKCGALPPLPYMCLLKILSRYWVETGWSFTSTPLHVSTERFITWLGWDNLELYLHSPTCVHWNFYHLCRLRIGGALPQLPYMCPQKILSRGCVEKVWSFTSILPYMCPLNFLSRGWVEKLWSSTSTLPCMRPLNFLSRGNLRVDGALPPLPFMCPQNFLSRGSIENVCSST